jgi:hypothetical protein
MTSQIFVQVGGSVSPVYYYCLVAPKLSMYSAAFLEFHYAPSLSFFTIEGSNFMSNVVRHYCPSTCGLCLQRRSAEEDETANAGVGLSVMRSRRAEDTAYDFFGPGVLKSPAGCTKENCAYYASFHRPQGEADIVFELGGTNLA